MQKLAWILFLFIGTSFFMKPHEKYSLVEQKNETYKVLFIGNSLTYTNNLPQLVKKMAKQQGIKIRTEMLAFPNYGLEDHLNNPNLAKLISTGNFDYVIIQQGPSSVGDGRESLIEYGEKIKSFCDKSKSQLAYFMVWPPISRYFSFDDVISHYRTASELNNALLCPVGKVWKSYIDKTQNFEYYSTDGFHPSKKGSQVAAQVIVETLFADKL